MMVSSSPEKGTDIQKSPDSGHRAVIQPEKAAGLEAFVEEINKISETASGGAGEQWSGTGSGQTPVVRSGQQVQISARDLAIANLPESKIMQKELEKHIREEVKTLRKEAKRITHVSQPGGAHRMNQLYSRIRHLNSLLSAIFEASVDVVKRLFIRVFIDKQTIQ